MAIMPLSISVPVPDTDKILVMMRPERIQILNGHGVDPLVNQFTGTVSDIVYQGDSYLLNAHLDDGTEVSLRGIIRRGTIDSLPATGSPIVLGLHANDTVLISGDEA